MATKVVVVAEVRGDGSIGEMFLVPNRILDELRTLGFEASAFDAMRRSKIDPGSVNGRPETMHVVVPMSFVP
jgi:hypothetical protein